MDNRIWLLSTKSGLSSRADTPAKTRKSPFCNFLLSHLVAKFGYCTFSLLTTTLHETRRWNSFWGNSSASCMSVTYSWVNDWLVLKWSVPLLASFVQPFHCHVSLGVRCVATRDGIARLGSYYHQIWSNEHWAETVLDVWLSYKQDIRWRFTLLTPPHKTNFRYWTKRSSCFAIFGKILSIMKRCPFLHISGPLIEMKRWN